MRVLVLVCGLCALLVCASSVTAGTDKTSTSRSKNSNWKKVGAAVAAVGALHGASQAPQANAAASGAIYPLPRWGKIHRPSGSSTPQVRVEENQVGTDLRDSHMSGLGSGLDHIPQPEAPKALIRIPGAAGRQWPIYEGNMITIYKEDKRVDRKYVYNSQDGRRFRFPWQKGEFMQVGPTMKSENTYKSSRASTDEVQKQVNNAYTTGRRVKGYVSGTDENDYESDILKKYFNHGELFTNDDKVGLVTPNLPSLGGKAMQDYTDEMQEEDESLYDEEQQFFIKGYLAGMQAASKRSHANRLFKAVENL